MGKILITALKICLLIFILAFLTVLGYWLHITYDFSYFFLVLAFLGILAAILLLYMLRRLYYRRRERRFIRRMLDQGEATLKINEENQRLNSLRQRWDKGLQILKSSRLRLWGNPIYTLPWFMVIGESGAGKSTAISHARSLASASSAGPLAYVPNTKNCDWWFFDKAVILDTSGRYAMPQNEDSDDKEWREFLSLIMSQRRYEPLNGLVLVISAERLLANDTAAICDYGRLIRQRLQEVNLSLGADVPVYIMVSKIDKVLGLTELAAMMAPARQDQALGLLKRDADGSNEDFLRITMEKVQNRLKELGARLAAVQGVQDGRSALFAREFASLQPGLSAFIQNAFSPNPYSETPLLRGLFFSSGRQEGEVYSNSLKGLETFKNHCWRLPGSDAPLFLNNFFAVILPKERRVARVLDSLISRMTFTRNLGYILWLCFLLSLCGYFTLSFIHNRAALNHMAANIKFPQPLNPDINEAIQQLDALAALIYAQSEQIQNREWQYWGYSQARAAIAFSKERYVDWMRTRVFMQHELDLSRTLANLPKESRTLAMAVYCEYLSWQNKILLAVDRKEEAPSPIADIDLAYTDRSGAALPLNNPALNRVFAVYILWETPQGRQRMRDYINAAIRKNIAVLSNYSDWISQWLHTRSLLSPVYMSKYWPQADPSWNISRAYTARARERMEQMLANLEEAAENKEVFQEMAAHYRRQYASEYRSAWWRMAADFNMGPAFFDTGAQWRNMAATMTGVDNPYFQFIQDMAENLKAVKDLAGRQPIDDLPAVFTSLIQESQSYSRDLTLGQRLEEVARGVSMRNLEEKAGAAFLNKASAKSENEVLFNKLFADYLKSLEPIYTNGNYEAQSMQMAQDGYSGGGKESAITAASLTAARALASGLDHNFTRHQIFWDLVEGPIAFLTYRAVYRSACYLNTMWENDILSKTYQVDAAKRWLILFAHDGLVSKFMQGPVKPFLKSTISGWTAAEWLGIAYPLQHEFIAFLNMANVDYNAPQAEYKVTFKAYPIAVNRQAEKPYLARLTLSSDSGSQVLENYNYPTKQTFTWKPAENSKVRMEIFFSGVSFSKEWFGPWAFRDFLRSFENSTLTLNRNDFPGNEEIMDELDMEYIELRYDIDGGKPVTRLTDPPVISALPLTAAFCYIGSSQNSVSSSLPVIHLAPLSAGGARNKP